MKLNNYPLSRKDNIVVQDAGDEVLLYDLNDNKAFCLNETSAMVWELCDGNSSVADINGKLSKKMKQSTSEELVWLALDQLKKEKLLTNAEDIKIDYNGLSRREAVKKVGLASLVAIPMIMAITSPVAATSASVCNLPGMSFDQTLCQCFDASCNGPVSSTALPAGTVCSPVVGGNDCNALGTACMCYSSGFCVGNTLVVMGTCS